MPRREFQIESWCGRRDSNPHDLRRWNLNPVRLPIPPRPRTDPVRGVDIAQEFWCHTSNCGAAPFRARRSAEAAEAGARRGVENGVAIKPIGPVQVRNVAGLAKMVDTE